MFPLPEVLLIIFLWLPQPACLVLFLLWLQPLGFLPPSPTPAPHPVNHPLTPHCLASEPLQPLPFHFALHRKPQPQFHFQLKPGIFSLHVRASKNLSERSSTSERSCQLPPSIPGWQMSQNLPRKAELCVRGEYSQLFTKLYLTNQLGCVGVCLCVMWGFLPTPELCLCLTDWGHHISLLIDTRHLTFEENYSLPFHSPKIQARRRNRK